MNSIQKFTLILFKLPDGKLVLQRRTKDAPYGAGLLGIFGGWVEDGETVEECIFRETGEETSLAPASLDIRRSGDFVIPAGEDFPDDRHFFWFEANIDNLDFEVYEGDRAEAYTPEELAKRSDLTGSAQHFVKNISGGQTQTTNPLV